MDSALSPREIQARIRGGESLETVAEAAGVPAEQIEPFAAPVIAEREHVLGQALDCPVRRKGESSSTRALRHVAAEGLQHGGISDEGVTWDAWRDPERQWIVAARFSEDDKEREARFGFDLRSRFSVARDDVARALIGEPGRSVLAPRPVARHDPDDEPTVDLDERRAAGSPDSAGSFPEFPARPIPRQPIEQVQIDDEPELSVESSQDDLVGHSSQLDVLYDMLSSFDEDSVNVYADLSRPITDDDRDDDLLSQAFDEPAEPNTDESTTDETTPTQATSGQTENDLEDLTDLDDEASTLPNGPADVGIPDLGAPASLPEASAEPISEPSQGALLEVADEVAPKPRPKPRKGRASIPTWDEIVFGGPKPK